MSEPAAPDGLDERLRATVAQLGARSPHETIRAEPEREASRSLPQLAIERGEQDTLETAHVRREALRRGALLGVGGMGEVYEGVQRSLGRSVALKFVTEEDEVVDRDARASPPASLVAIFMAITLPIERCSPEYTSPMPPTPSSARMFHSVVFGKSLGASRASSGLRTATSGSSSVCIGGAVVATTAASSIVARTVWSGRVCSASRSPKVCANTRSTTARTSSEVTVCAARVSVIRAGDDTSKVAELGLWLGWR